MAVTAYSCAGLSPPAVVSTTLSPIAPGAPHDVTVTANTTAISVAWQCPDGATPATVYYYVVESASPVDNAGSAAGPNWSVVDTVRVSCCNVTFAGLSPDYEYVYSVAAANGAGRSAAAVSQGAVPGSMLPVAPAGVVAVSSRANEVVLTWLPVTDDLSLNGGSPITGYTFAGVFAANNSAVSVEGVKAWMSLVAVVEVKVAESW